MLSFKYSLCTASMPSFLALASASSVISCMTSIFSITDDVSTNIIAVTFCFFTWAMTSSTSGPSHRCSGLPLL